MSDKPVVNHKKGNGINRSEHKELIRSAKNLAAKNRKIEREKSFVFVPVTKGFAMVALEKFNTKTNGKFKLSKRGSKDFSVQKKDVEEIKQILCIR